MTVLVHTEQGSLGYEDRISVVCEALGKSFSYIYCGLAFSFV